MKTFLRIACVQLFICLTIGAIAQTTLPYTTSGTFTWSPPAGVTSVTLQMWGAGGYGIWGSFSGGGGAFVQTSSIPVVYGTTYNIVVGSGFGSSAASSFGPVGGSTIISAQGGSTNSTAGGAASTGPYVLTSYPGGNGAFPADYFSPAGGGAGAGTCGAGASGSQSGYGAGSCGGGSGGDLNGTGVGGAPGGGGACIFGNNNTVGGNGEILLTYSCNVGNTGQIGNAHAITYPPEVIPDNITSTIDPQLASGVSITWQQSTDNINFIATQTANTTTTYRFDQDNLQTTTYYRRGNNACLTAGTFGNWSNTVQIKVMAFANGRNGGVTGLIKTKSGSPIKDRKIFVQALTPLKGRSANYLDSAFSDQQGKFSVDSIFYGDKNNGDSATVRFKVYPDTAQGHKYSPVSAEISLNTIHPTYDLSSAPFSDITVFAVTGQVTQVCKGCLDSNGIVKDITGALDSVLVKGVGKSGNLLDKDSTRTGYINSEYGRYALTFPDADQYTVTPSFRNHKFVPKDSVFTVNSDVSNINFNDTTTHVITGFFGAGCGDVIGTAVLEFDDSLPVGFDGKVRASVFRKKVTTKANGKFSISLPARAFKVKILSVTVNDPYDASTTQAAIKSFFKALPADSIYRDISTHDTTLNLVYQRPPQMRVSGLIDSSIIQNCSAFNKFAIWPQEEIRPVTFNVYQGPISRGCSFDKGKVYLTTDISNMMGKLDKDTIPVVNGKGIINLRALQPNPLKDGDGNYAKYFSAKYIDPAGRAISTDTAKPALPIIVVTGVAIDTSAKTFLTVTPQIPLLVLHDPPGNQSFSTYAKSVSSEQAISFQAENALSTGGWIDVKLGLDVILGIFLEEEDKFWADIKASVDITNTENNTKESVIKTTTTSTFSTSNDPGYVGPDDDLFYGAAMNMKYSEGTEVDWDSLNCAFSSKPVLIFAPEGIKTSFVYTLAEIRDQQIPKLQLAAQAKPDSASFFNNQIQVWQQVLDNNELNKQKAAIDSNLSFVSGNAISSSTTASASSTNTYEFNMEIDTKLATEVGFEIAGTGVSGGFDVGFKMTTGESTTTTNTVETTIGYTLQDNNTGGLFSVNVKKDPVYGTPMFETVAGESSCPHEEGTVALDNTVITTKTPTLTNVKLDSANFTVHLGNLSIDPNPRTYLMFLDASSNPDGASVSINGFTDPTGVPLPIKHGENQQATITVRRNSAGGVYNYDNLHLILSDPCFPPTVQQFLLFPHQYSDIYLSADFTSPVSGVTMVSPVNNWVANIASNNSITVTFNGYDTSKLSSIAFQYNVPGQNTWKTVTSISKKKLGKTSTMYTWNITNIADGPYNLRLMVKDKFGNTVYSQVATGIIDRKAPEIFGVPRPVSGVYKAGTQIAFSYTKAITNTNLRNSMVDFKDMTTGTPVPFRLSAFLNRVIITPLVSILPNKGHVFRVITDSVTDLYGNVKTRPDTLLFKVGTTIFSTTPDALNVTTNPASIYEDSKASIKLRFTRNSPATDALVIYYNLAGNGMYNKDYTVSYNNGQTSATGINGDEGMIVLPKDSSGTSLYIHPINDSILAPDKILTITLSEGGGYSIGSNYTVADTILNHNTAKPVITANKGTTLCSGDSVTLSTSNKINGESVKSYLWSTGAKTQSITIKTSGSYTVSVTDKNGLTGYSAPRVVTITCSAPTGLAVNVVNKSKAYLSWNSVTCAKKYVARYRTVGQSKWITDTLSATKDTITGLKANTTYEWQVQSICQYPVIIASSYAAGANFTTPVSLTDIAVSSTPDYTKAAAGDGFSAAIYPNPAITSANLEVKGTKGAYNVMLTNMQGIVLWKAEGLTGSSVKIPLNSFAQGVYMVLVSDQTHTGKLKLVKQ